jgi:hypothetical protein
MWQNRMYEAKEVGKVGVCRENQRTEILDFELKTSQKYYKCNRKVLLFLQLTKIPESYH